MAHGWPARGVTAPGARSSPLTGGSAEITSVSGPMIYRYLRANAPEKPAMERFIEAVAVSVQTARRWRGGVVMIPGASAIFMIHLFGPPRRSNPRFSTGWP